jgi:serine protease Do
VAAFALAIGLALGSYWTAAVGQGESAPGVPAVPVVAPGPGAPQTFSQVAAAVKPAVINIRTITVIRTPGRSPLEEFFGEEFFRRFFGEVPREQVQRSLGSGVIVEESGIALTNAHVIARATEIEVQTADRKKHKAKVVGSDPKTDMAVIRILGGGMYPAARLGNSDALNVGDWVMAVGSPFGLEQTVTVGIVSAKGRVIGAGPFDDFIQTDAAINPGNSGGPLVNMAGEVVGINTAIVARGQGLGFAIPINMAKKIYAEISTKGKVSRGWLGVSIQPLTEELAKGFGAKADQGVLVADVLAGSPATAAGIKAGDIILEFEGKKIASPEDLPRLVGLTEPGKVVKVKILHEKAEKLLDVKIAEAPEESVAAAPGRGKAFIGLEVRPLTPELASRLGLSSTQGVVVVDVQEGSPADGAGVQQGDVVREVNRQPVRTVADFERIIGGVKPGERVVMRLQRQGMNLFVAFMVGQG